MKKISFLFVAGFLSLSLNCFSQQLFINSSGHVGINQLAPTYNLDWAGNGRFWAIPGWGAFIFDSSNNGVVTMHPYEDWVGSLGTPTKRFNYMYVYKLYYDQLEDWSDARLKENIKPLENNLSRILLLKGVSYNMKKEFYNISDQEMLSKAMNDSKTDFGFLAQEIKEVFPEVVSLDSTTSYYSVNYVKLIPVLIEAIKEQQVQIEELKKQISK